MASIKKKGKGKGSEERTTAANITFENVSRSECGEWWANVEDDHVLKAAL